MKVIQIIYNKFKKRVLTDLAFVGKRQQTTKGDPYFSATTFSSAEEVQVESAIASATSIIVKELKEYIVGYCTIKDNSSEKITGLEFTVVNNRSDEDMEEALEQAVGAFVVSYSTATILTRISPDLAKTLYEEANTFLQSAVSLAVNKEPVIEPMYSIDSVKGSVTLDDNNHVSDI